MKNSSPTQIGRHSIRMTLLLSFVLQALLMTGCGRNAVALGEENLPPIARIDGPSETWRSDPVTLDGTGSTDPDGAFLIFRWSVSSSPEGASFEISEADTEQVLFTADSVGLYELEVVVVDKWGERDSAVHGITVRPRPDPIAYLPVADAGPDRVVLVGRAAMLDGTGSSDPDGELIAYDWKAVVWPPGGISPATFSGEIAEFHPDSPGEYTMQLTVQDGDGHRDSDQMVVTALRPGQDAVFETERVWVISGIGGASLVERAVSYLGAPDIWWSSIKTTSTRTTWVDPSDGKLIWREGGRLYKFVCETCAGDRGPNWDQPRITNDILIEPDPCAISVNEVRVTPEGRILVTCNFDDVRDAWRDLDGNIVYSGRKEIYHLGYSNWVFLDRELFNLETGATRDVAIPTGLPMAVRSLPDGFLVVLDSFRIPILTGTQLYSVSLGGTVVYEGEYHPLPANIGEPQIPYRSAALTSDGRLTQVSFDQDSGSNVVVTRTLAGKLEIQAAVTVSGTTIRLEPASLATGP